MSIVQYRGAKGGSYMGYKARLTFGSRRAISEELYLGLAFAGMFMRYSDYFFDYESLPEEGAISQSTLRTTGFVATMGYNMLGIIAAGGVGAGALATGNILYGSIVALSIPLQFDIMNQNLDSYTKNEGLRRYFKQRSEYIKGVHA